MTARGVFVMVHGAWHGGWCWERVAARLRAAGHAVATPTLAGLGERAGDDPRGIVLDTHVQDVVQATQAAVREAGVRAATLVAHSYGGFPATVAAQRLGRAVDHLVLLDAFLPADGEKLLDHAPAFIDAYAARLAADPAWRIPPLAASLFGVDDDDRQWVDAQLTPHPAATYFGPARLAPQHATPRRSYIRCMRAPGDLLARSEARVRADPAWTWHALDAGHDAMVSAPQALAALLLKL